MRGCELKGLRWGYVDLIDHTLTVGRATTKTDAGERIIPLNADAVVAIVELYRRARMSSGTEANHYVFPSCENGKLTSPAHRYLGAQRDSNPRPLHEQLRQFRVFHFCLLQDGMSGSSSFQSVRKS
jgi:integrase